MRILVTGSAGHLGEALMRTLRAAGRDAIGIDVLASPCTDRVGSVADRGFVRQSMAGVGAVLHAATLHKPHVATHRRQDFIDTNVTGTLNLLEEAAAAGVRAFVFTSTTSTFGDALTPPASAPAAWITEEVRPAPKNIYGVTKVAAEDLCQLFQRNQGLPCLVLRTSRFFPEDDDNAATAESYANLNVQFNELLYRRVDIEDVVGAHLLALERAPALGFGRYVISATTPFTADDLAELRSNAPAALRRHYPQFEAVYAQRGWRMFPSLDRVYVNALARRELGWQPRHDFGQWLEAAARGEDPRSELARQVGAKGYHRLSERHPACCALIRGTFIARMWQQDGGTFMTRVSRCTPLALALAALAPAAWAQSVTPPALAASGPSVLPTVNVTAERTTANVKDVPSSVSTISGEKLDVLNSSGEDVRFISGRVPSLNIESSFGRAFPRFYIRGYGNTDFHLNASQPVSLIYDDVVQENPILKGFPLFDLDRVEVLAGPQGTLFGRNTPAGVVKFDSVRPGPLREGYFNASYGRFGTRNLEGAYTLPLGPEWSSRISLQSQHRDDWVNNFSAKRQNDKLEGYDDNAGRLQLLYKPSTSFEALFNLHGRTLDGTARVFRANIIKPGTNEFVDGFNPSTVFTDGKNEQALNTGGGSARLRWKIGDYALNSITGYEHVSAFSRGDIDGGFGASYAPPFGPGFIPFASESSDALKGHRQLSQEFRIESLLAGPFQWQAGLYYFYEKFGIDSLSYDTLFGGPTTTVQAHQKNDAYAIFGSASYALSKAFTVKGGLRYTKDKKSLGTNSADTAIDTSGGLYRKTDDGKLNFDVSALYAVTPDANLYARIATGFRGSSIYPASAFGPLTSAAPETNTSYEVGAKADLLDKRARGSVSLFHYDVKDQQLSAVGGSDNKTLLLSAKKAMGQGVELNFDAYITDRLLVTLNGSYNMTKIKDPGLRVGVCAACTVTDPTVTLASGQKVAIIDGNSLPQAPRYIANITARYGIPVADNAEFFVYTDWSYRSKVNFFLYDSIEFIGKPLTTGGLRLGYQWQSGKYEVAAFARNITNQKRIVGGIDFDNLTGFINEPRTYGVQFKTLF